MTFIAPVKFAIDLLAVLLLALGIKGLSKVRSAREANRLAAIAMILAAFGVLLNSQGTIGISINSWIWIICGTLIGGLLGALTAKRVPMTAMPEIVALFNGCGGMSSLLVALGVALFPSAEGSEGVVSDLIRNLSIVVSLFVGAITFSGSIVAMAKLQGWLSTPSWTQSKARHFFNILCAVIALIGGIYLSIDGQNGLFIIVVASSLLGIGVTLPIGGADMPVVISLLNSYSGVAAAAAGFVVGSQLLIVAGAMVGAAGLILTQVMCAGMNRSLVSVLFGGALGASSVSSGGGGGGGSKNELLNQMTANSTGLPVVSGPIEATAIGNILIQMIALGEIDDIENGRLLVRRSFRNEINNYTPVNRNKWIEAKNSWDVYSESI